MIIVFLSYYIIILFVVELESFRKEVKLILIEICDDVFVVSYDYG